MTSQWTIRCTCGARSVDVQEFVGEVIQFLNRLGKRIRNRIDYFRIEARHRTLHPVRLRSRNEELDVRVDDTLTDTTLQIH